MNLKNIYKKYIGSIEYIVTLVNVSGEVQKDTFDTTKELDEFIVLINSNKYWSVQKIEKIRKYSFQYNKNIIHSPLFFSMNDVTELYNINDQDYSFLKIDESLTNVTRKMKQ